MSIDFPGNGGGGADNTITVANISDRNDLTVDIEKIVRVLNATADPTVDTGSAWYQWDAVDSSYQKISETESNNIEQATESLKGIAELATQAESDAGTDDTRMVTPFKMHGFVKKEIVPLGDGTLTSLSITNLNKIYFVKAGATLTTITIPESIAGNNRDDLKIVKDPAGGVGDLRVLTAGGQNVGGGASQDIKNSLEFIEIKSDVANPTDDWILIGDTRTDKVVVDSAVAYGAGESWVFDFLNIGLATSDLDVTLPVALTNIDEGSSRTITNSNKYLVYLRRNSHLINGEAFDYRILPDGYITITKLDGVLQITGNHNANKDIDLTTITGIDTYIDSTDQSTYTASDPIISIDSVIGSRTFTKADNDDNARDAGYNATGTPSGKPSLTFNGTDQQLSDGGDGTVHGANGLYMCIAFKPTSGSVLSQYSFSGSDKCFDVGSESIRLSKGGFTPDAKDTSFFRITPGEWVLIETIWEASARSSAYISGSKSGVSDNNINSIKDSSLKLVIGGYDDSTTANLFSGEVSQVLIASDIPSDDERTLIRQKLADVTGIDLSRAIPTLEVFSRQADGKITPLNPDDRMSADFTKDGTTNRVFSVADDIKLAALNTNSQTLALILALG